MVDVVLHKLNTTVNMIDMTDLCMFSTASVLLLASLIRLENSF